MKLCVASFAALLCAATVSLAQAADSKPAGTQAPADPQVEMVCTNEQSTGSHQGHRVCMSRKQREERAREDQQAMEGLKRAGGAASPGTSIGH